MILLGFPSGPFRGLESRKEQGHGLQRCGTGRIEMSAEGPKVRQALDPRHRLEAAPNPRCSPSGELPAKIDLFGKNPQSGRKFLSSSLSAISLEALSASCCWQRRWFSLPDATWNHSTGYRIQQTSCPSICKPGGLTRNKPQSVVCFAHHFPSLV